MTDEPLAQFSSLNGPVPTGCVALVSTLLGSTMIAVAWPRRNNKLGSIVFMATTTVASSTGLTNSMLWNSRLSLFVLFSPAARSNANLTVCALNGSPFWNFTPLRSLKVTVFRSGEISQLSASSGVTLPSEPIFVSVSNTL